MCYGLTNPAARPRGRVGGQSPAGGRSQDHRRFGAWATTSSPRCPGAIPFGGLDADDPLAFKVYQPDRLVLGKRMEEHLRIGVCLWHSFAWDGRDMFGAGTLDRPWLAPGRDPMDGGPREDGRGLRVPRQARRPVLLLPRRRRRARGRDLRGVQRQPRRARRRGRSATRSAPACGSCGAPPTCSPTRATRPAPPRTPTRRCSPTPRRRSGTCSRSPSAWAARTTSCGAGARATTRCSTPTCAARASSSPGSCTSSPSTSTGSASRARCSSSPSRWSRRSTSTTTTPRPSTASSSGTASTGEYRLNIEANHATLAGHCFHHEVAYAVANGMFGSIDANRGDPQNGWDTDQFPNSVEDLVMPLYEILKGGGFTTGGFNFDAKLRRQSIDRTDLFHAHIGGIDTLARALLIAADMLEAGTLASMVEAALRRLGRRRWARDPGRSDVAGGPRRAGRGGRDRPARGQRPPGAVRERGEPATSGEPADGGAGGRPRDRRLDDGDQGGPRRRGRDPSSASPRASTRSSSRIRCGASRTRRLVDRRRSGDPRRPGRDRGRPVDDRGRRASRGRCTASCCSTRRTGSSGRRSCGTTSGRARSATLIRQALGPERLIADHGQRRPHGVHGAEARLGPRPRARRLGPGRPRAAAQGLRPAAADRRARPRQGRRGGHPPVRPGGARLVGRGARGAGRSRAAWLPPTFEGPEVTGVVTAGGGGGDGAARGHARRRRRRRPGGERGGRRRGGAGPDGALAGDVGGRLRHDRRAALRTGGPRPRLLPRGAGPLAPHVGDALGRRQPALVPGRDGARSLVRRPRGRRPRTFRPEATGCRSCRT